MNVLGIILCIVESLLEVGALIIVIGVPFVLIGLVCVVIERYTREKNYKMGTRRQKLHRKLYDFLIKLGYDSNTAYNMATQFIGWR